MSESPYCYSFDFCFIFQGFGLPGYLLVYSSLLFRVTPEQLDQRNVPTSDKTKILKVIQSQGIQKSFFLFQCQRNHATAFNRFVSNHFQWKKAMVIKVDIEKLLKDINDSALIYLMHNIRI